MDFPLQRPCFGFQLVLPGQFVDIVESPLLSFLEKLQNTMAGRYPRHNSTPAPTTLMEELLLARFVLSFQLPSVEGTGHPTCSCQTPNRLKL